MVLDYMKNETQAFIYVVQEWKRLRWNQVTTTHDLKDAVMTARSRHYQTSEPVRVLRVEEDVIVTYDDPYRFSDIQFSL